MTCLPEPLVPPDTDVRNLDGFMLNVERLIASELWALSTGDEFKAAMALWCRAWKQFPAGSLPDDDKVLAAFSGAGKTWPKVRAMAMRGFVKCSDNRWYHRVLCEDVKRAALKKQERHERTKAATEARKKQRHDHRNDERDVRRDDPQNINVTNSHRQDRDRTGTLKETPDGVSVGRASRLPPAWTLPAEWFDWALAQAMTPDAIHREAEKFRDYWIAKSGSNARKVDWLATWRIWIRRTTEQENHGNRTANGHGMAADRSGSGAGKPPRGRGTLDIEAFIGE